MVELGTPAQVAEALHTTEASLAQMRYRGDGPIFIRAGRRRVLYLWSDVDRWIEESRHTRTDEPVRIGDDRLGGKEAGSSSSRASGRPGRRNRDERD
jgi:hypothetical protein